MNNIARGLVPVLLLLSLAIAACGGRGSTGSASVDPILGDPNVPTSGEPIGDPPGPGGPVAGELTIPRPGQLDVHPVAAEVLEAQVNGRAVTVRLTWTSGVEPCYVLDSIAVGREGNNVTLTILEGHGPGDNICIEIAQTKQALVELGELAPGTYSILDSQGVAAPIDVTIS
jgi:hypothetical protein